MYAHSTERSGARRGIVLVVILAMLGLMALIGVTFATFAGQSQISSRNFARALDWPDPDQLMDYALAQLINDTNNPNSALRGHSLLRDMFGNDSVMNNPVGLNNSQINCYLDSFPDPKTGFVTPLAFQAAQLTPVSSANGTILQYMIQYRTNIPSGTFLPGLYGVNFTRWYLRFSGTPGFIDPTGVIANNVPPTVAQTFEVVADTDGFVQATTGGGNFALDSSGAHTNHVLTLTLDANLLINPAVPSVIPNPAAPFQRNPYFNLNTNNGSPNLLGPPGLPVTTPPTTTFPPAVIASVGMTPTIVFDASGNPIINSSVPFVLDGRFLNAFNGAGISARSFTSGSGEINAGLYPNFAKNGGLLPDPTLPANTNLNPLVPSIGNPDVTGMDEDYDACDLENWFLAIQSADGKVMIPSFHRPGILRYTSPLVNDWVSTVPDSSARFLRPRKVDHPQSSFADLIPDPTTGQITYDVDNDGDGATDSVWLDLGYPAQRDPTGKLFKPLFSFLVIGLNGRMPLNTVGNLQSRDLTTYTNASTGAIELPPNMPNYDHASSHGYSPSEINPKYALQNAHFQGTYSGDQVDNGGVPVWLTQLRNLLAGTRTHVDPYNPILAYNQDANFVLVNGKAFYMPNGVVDTADGINTSVTPHSVHRATASTPGRWGEGDWVPQFIFDQNTADPANAIPALNQPFPGYINYNNPIRAGRSPVSAQPPYLPTATDMTDDNFTTYDFYPFYDTRATSLNHPETYNYLDLSGALALPSERMRRFLTPVDLAGIGKVVAYNTPTTVFDPWGTGSDPFGRVSYFRHFRPPGTPGKHETGGWVDQVDLAQLNNPVVNPTHGYDAFRLPFGSNQPEAMGGMPYDQGADQYANPNPMTPYVAGPPAIPQSPVTYLQNLRNMVSGVNYYTFQQITPGAPAPALSQLFPGAGGYTPSFTPIGPYTNPNIKVNTSPTFDEIRGNNGHNWIVRNGYPLGSLGRDEADEMNLYATTPNDAPFGPTDLEWLYRVQDVDGYSLTSRLSQLAPISFTNPSDGQTRRRLFSIDTWETNNIVWANDNPVSNLSNQTGTLPMGTPLFSPYNQPPIINPRFPTLPLGSFVPGYNARFAVGQNANLVNLTTNLSLAVNSNTTFTNPVALPYTMPRRAHRNRKINLNAPLPISNSPNEPVRHQWILDSYNLLKMTLPPQAVDTPEELAELSQYLINVIDFRDPDGTCTHFSNPDLLTRPGTATAPPKVVFANQFMAGDVPLDQYGMEYSPIAIDEVLAYQFQYKDPTKASTNGNQGSDYPRLFIEVVNTLMTPDGQNTKNTDLDLKGWQFLILPDGPSGRPDPVTGQIPKTNVPYLKPVFVNYTGAGTTDPSTAGAASLMNPVPALLSGQLPTATGNADNNTHYYYVFGNNPPTNLNSVSPPIKFEANPPPAVDNQLPWDYTDMANLTTSDGAAVGGGSNKYNSIVRQLLPPLSLAGGTRRALVQNEARLMWLYLLRPADPFNTTATSPMVVVDAIRFPFVEGGGRGTTNTALSPPQDTIQTAPGSAPYTNSIWAVEREQPYRGGHLIKPDDKGIDPTDPANGTGNPATVNTGATPPSPANAYGYSEQTAPSTNATGPLPISGWYGTTTNPGVATTLPIKNTLGNPTHKRPENWDFFPFHDRDFQSVAELLLVPGCPPGLFTKQFVENAPPDMALGAYICNSDTAPNTPAGLMIPTGMNIGHPFVRTAPPAPPPSPPVLYNMVPRTYPYLIDKFYYTAANDITHAPNPGASSPPDPALAYNPDGSLNTPGAIDGYTSAGWFKMFDFFEVPTSAFGGIGQVQDGENFDWARQDRRPGLLNLNLIIDQEVFLGLFDDQRLDMSPALNLASLPQVVTQINFNGYPNVTVPFHSQPFYYPNEGDAFVPNGTSYGNANVGGLSAAFSDFLKLRHGGSGFMFAYGSGVVGSGVAPSLTTNVALNQFTSPVTQWPIPYNNNINNAPVAAERPFRSFSYPDINHTIMRPATLPPVPPISLGAGTSFNFTNPPQNTVQPSLAALYGTSMAATPLIYRVTDPGEKNPYFTPTETSGVPLTYGGTPPNTYPTNLLAPKFGTSDDGVPQPPPIPPRRLFQIPDVANFSIDTSTNAVTQTVKFTGAFPGTASPIYTSNAAQGDPSSFNYDRGEPEINLSILMPNLGNLWGSLTQRGGDVPGGVFTPFPNPAPPPALLPIFQYTYTGAVNSGGTVPIDVNGRFLGASQYLNQSPTLGVQATATPPLIEDTRAHPFFRTEMLQKVMNLTTVRTHQFAVWITVGFFEVVQAGDPAFYNAALGVVQPQPDELGQELGLIGGKNVRYRSFFILDRTKATGFCPSNPADFHSVVTYRRRIE